LFGGSSSHLVGPVFLSIGTALDTHNMSAAGTHLARDDTVDVRLERFSAG